MSNKPTLNQHEISNLKIPYLTIVTTLELHICLWTSQATRGVFVTLGFSIVERNVYVNTDLNEVYIYSPGTCAELLFNASG